jgi:hypothetical protein
MMSKTSSSSSQSSRELTPEEELTVAKNTESSTSASSDAWFEDYTDPALETQVKESDLPHLSDNPGKDPIDDDYYNDVVGTDFQLPKTTSTFSSRDLTSIFRIQADESWPAYRPLNILPSLRNEIEDQKKRAVAVWDGVLLQGTDPTRGLLPTSIPHADAAHVRAQLQQGLVPPAFHAFTIPEDQRIFDPVLLINSGLPPGAMEMDSVDRTVQLSHKQVVEGLSTTSRHSSMEHMLSFSAEYEIGPSISSDTSFDIYLPTFGGKTTPTPAAIAPNIEYSSGFMSHEIDYMKAFIDAETGFAYDTVYDPGHVSEDGWSFNAALTRHLVQLINTPAEMIGEDVEVTPLTSHFGLDGVLSLDQYVDTNLITRRLSRGVVLDCFRQIQRPARTFAITGNAGIGKSYTLLFAMQQALLFDRICVMFFLQKQRKAMICIRDNEKVYAWEGKTIQDVATSSLFSNPNVLVLVDPMDAAGGGAAFDNGARRLIYAASNHRAHFKSEGNEKSSRQRLAKTKSLERKRYLSPFTEEELRVALPYIIDVNRSTFDEAMQRTYEVGMNPRYILSKEAYTARKEQIDQYLTKLKSDPREIEALLDWNGIIGKDAVVPKTNPEETIPDRQFSISMSDAIDNFLEVDGIIVGTIGAKERIRHENPPPSPPPSPPPPRKPEAPKQLQRGKNLEVDGTMIFSIHAMEYLPIDIPVGPRSAAWIGYNGERNVRYTEQKMTITSPYIYDTLVQHLMKSRSAAIISLWAKVGCGPHNGMDNCIRDLFWQYIQDERKFVMELDKPRPQKMELLRKFKSIQLTRGIEKKNLQEEWSVPVWVRDRKVKIDTKELWPFMYLKGMFRTSRSNPNMGRMVDDCTIIQFSGPGRTVCRIVTDDDYNLPWNELVKLLVNGGYLLTQQKATKKNGPIVCAPNPPVPLHWYWIVPSTSFQEKWEKRTPALYKGALSTSESLSGQARRDMNRNKEQVNLCLQENVIQHILVMDTLHFAPPPPVKATELQETIE